MKADATPTTSPPCPQTGHMSKTNPASAPPEQAVYQDEAGVWHVVGFEAVRQVLRSELVQQAGFAAEMVDLGLGKIMKNTPILYLEGEEHHRARRETNKFFTPAITDREYRAFMDAYADEIVGRLQRDKRADLSDLSMEMAVRVAAQVVGLTDSWWPGGLKRRLEAMIETGNAQVSGAPTWQLLLGQGRTLSFFALDVWPAIRRRRREPRNDVISYLLSRDYTPLDILTECVVYGVAGMVTTREFISVALWHLLERPELAERMRVGEEAERYAILHEILRLEPVVSHLYRRTTQALTLTHHGEETVTIPAGEKLDLHIVAANLDEHAVGAESGALCPARTMNALKPKVPAYGLSFGDGAHRCPGAYVAIQESDIFLRRLLALPGLRMERAPKVSYFQVAESYEIRDFMLAVD